MRPFPEQSRRRARGFTLMEIILAMFVLVLLVTGIFAIVGGTTQLADEMERAHDRDARAHSFARFCERTLRNLPANAQVRMRLTQSGNQYLGELALRNAPSPIGSTGANGMTILRTEQAPDGYLRAVIEMLTNEEAAAKELGRGGVAKQRLVLLENVAKCEWKFFNSRSGEWESMWNDKLSFASQPAGGAATPVIPGQPGAAPPQAPVSLGNARRPGLVELNFAIGADAPRRFVFWVPPATAPGGLATGTNPPPPGSPPPEPPPGTGFVAPPPAVLPTRK